MERAEKLNAERTEAIRKATLAEAADIAVAEVKNAGLTDTAVDTIKRKILGL